MPSSSRWDAFCISAALTRYLTTNLEAGPGLWTRNRVSRTLNLSTIQPKSWRSSANSASLVLIEALWLWRFGLHCTVYGVGCVGRPRAQGVAGVGIRVMALSKRARQPMPDFAEADFFASVCGFLVLMPMQGKNLPRTPKPKPLIRNPKMVPRTFTEPPQVPN